MSLPRPTLPAHNLNFSVQPITPFMPTQFCLNEITCIANLIKKRDFPSFNSMNDEPNLWLNRYEEFLALENSLSMAKDIIIEFLDVVSIDFYNKITRHSQFIEWNDLKTSFIKFINLYKIKKIEESVELIYLNGKLTDFVLEKYELLTYSFPEIKEDSKYIRLNDFLILNPKFFI
jgi:hypothetical protein